MNLRGNEKSMEADDIIVSKTDLKGRITYANQTFLSIAEYSLAEVMGAPHSIVRNEAMPRCVFQLLWERLQNGNEVFAYVVNSTKGGDHYWVLAHVTPSRDHEGNIVGYHSNRRKPSPGAVDEPAVEDVRRRGPVGDVEALSAGPAGDTRRVGGDVRGGRRTGRRGAKRRPRGR